MARKRKKLNSKKLPKRIVTLSVIAALCTVLAIVGVKVVTFVAANGFLSDSAAATADAGNWRSKLYPEKWTPATPDSQGRFLHDFSYAGYMRGEMDIPSTIPGEVYDVTKLPYNADKKGEKDSTKAIQRAIDDAGAAGGGVVYLPAGTYKISVQNGSDTSVLHISKSGVVLRGDGPGKTFLFNKTTNMREKSVVRIQSTKSEIVKEEPAKSSKITKNYKLPTTVLAVADASKFKEGDWVSVSSALTSEWISEMKMGKLWTPKSDWQAFIRKVVAVDTEQQTITIDIPTRYEVLTKRDARVYVIKDPIEHVGIEKLSFGNEKNPKSGWDSDDNENKGTGAYEVDMSEYFRFNHVANSWMRQVATYEPPNNGGVHTLSTAIVLDEYARRMTLSDIDVRSPQYKGGGGNGYGIQIFGGDNLVNGCKLSGGRHNAVMSGPIATGNVFTDCMLRGGTEPSETHGRFSVSNLFENIVLANGENLTSEDRGGAGNSNHGLTSSETVFWNIKGSGTVTSQQYKVGYVIGTEPTVKINLQGNGGNLTGPTDYVEGANRASNLQPQSLYKHQLNRRLNESTLKAAVADEMLFVATTSVPVTDAAAETVAETPVATPATTPSSPAPSSATAPAPQARSVTFSTPGSHTFTVPAYAASLKVEVWGGGGGGGSNADDKKASGENGTTSSFDKVIARGGKGGDGGVKNQVVSGGNGGTAEGGDDNRTGDNGKNGNANGAGDGGASPKGGSGGNGADTPKNTTPIAGKDGSAPGGGGGGTAKMLSGGGYNNGAGGGGGGYATKSYAKGALVAGKTITVVVGEGGKGAAENVNGGNGARGEVRISWTE